MGDERDRSVFINCPFDKRYRRLFDPLVFTILFCGFNVRCAQEESNSGDIRLNKILRMVRESKLSIHDLSRVELDDSSQLPRFNMPLELGAAVGMHHTPEGVQGHGLLILDAEQFRYQKYVSDLGGVDIAHHSNRPRGMVGAVSGFLAHYAESHVASPSRIYKAYQLYKKMLPVLADSERQTVAELRYIDRMRHMTAFMTKVR
jgi:hypothetical protein